MAAHRKVSGGEPEAGSLLDRGVGNVERPLASEGAQNLFGILGARPGCGERRLVGRVWCKDRARHLAQWIVGSKRFGLEDIERRARNLFGLERVDQGLLIHDRAS